MEYNYPIDIDLCTGLLNKNDKSLDMIYGFGYGDSLKYTFNSKREAISFLKQNFQSKKIKKDQYIISWNDNTTKTAYFPCRKLWSS